MNPWAKWVLCAFVAFLAGCCQSGVASPTGGLFRRPVTEPTIEGVGANTASKSESGNPQPGNAFAAFIDNKFNSWTVSRVDMPLATKSPDRVNTDGNQGTAKEQLAAPAP